ncbi:SagB/ThcOx family dehydrogenase [bacterium]|nr:SagB/ThcOx family dehydrogenase [bacterium]
METRHLLLFIFSLLIGAGVWAQPSSELIRLPAPDTTGGRPLMQVLKERRSIRSYSDRALSDTTLANLLWAAFGVNRPDGRRTAPSARNRQEINIYLFKQDGVFFYQAAENALERISNQDLRKLTGSQDFVATAPLNLLYVADMSKLNGTSSEEAALYIGADCGLIAENVYLYCTSEGLATVVRGMVNRTALTDTLKLPITHRIVLAQTVGYPK